MERDLRAQGVPLSCADAGVLGGPFGPAYAAAHGIVAKWGTQN